MARFISKAVSLKFMVGVGVLVTGILPHNVILAQEPVRPLAIVQRFIPTVTLYSLDEDPVDLVPVEDQGEYLFDGDTLKTDAKGYALVKFTDNTIAKVKPESILIVRGEERPNDRNINRRIDLEKGQIFLEVEPQGSGSFDVATTRSVASVKGTKFGATDLGYVWVREGQVDVTATNSGQTVSLFQQMFASVDANGNNIETGALTEDEANNLEEGFDTLDEDLIERTILIRFRDANGQVRTVPVTIFEKGN